MQSTTLPTKPNHRHKLRHLERDASLRDVCFRSGDYMNVDEVYEDITNMAALKKKMVELLSEYNNFPGVVRMDLVLFRDAIDHGIFVITMQPF